MLPQRSRFHCLQNPCRGKTQFACNQAADDARQHARAAGRLSRRQPLHDLGLQVRPARGGGEAAEALLAGREVPVEPETPSLFTSAGIEPDEEARDVCFDKLDRYVELEVAGRDADAAIPGLRAHLEGCPGCREEHESL
jgi:hypothetical protein